MSQVSGCGPIVWEFSSLLCVPEGTACVALGKLHSPRVLSEEEIRDIDDVVVVVVIQPA